VAAPESIAHQVRRRPLGAACPKAVAGSPAQHAGQQRGNGFRTHRCPVMLYALRLLCRKMAALASKIPRR
jgi:hypothetical protein